MYLISGFGITVGYHRLLTHRAFRTHKPVEYVFAVAGSLAIQGGPLDGVADHRKRHAHPDVEGDPHSPHLHGVIGAVRGLWHAHGGWTWQVHGMATHERCARELREDRGTRIIHCSFPLFILVSAALPFGLGVLIGGSVAAGLTGLLWGGLNRVLVQSHVTWSVNSVCHFFGSRRFDVDDHRTNVWWLALPRSARHGRRRREVDRAGLLVAAMKRLRLAWDVVEIPPERQQAKLAAGAPHDA